MLYHLFPGVLVHYVMPLHLLLPSGRSTNFTMTGPQLRATHYVTSAYVYTSLTEFVILSIITLISIFIIVAIIANNCSRHVHISIVINLFLIFYVKLNMKMPKFLIKTYIEIMMDTECHNEKFQLQLNVVYGERKKLLMSSAGWHCFHE